MTEHLVALTPAEVPVAQADLVDWCQRKLVALGRELSEARQNLTIAKDAGWRRNMYVNAIAKVRARMIYFAKIKAAVSEGYLVVPNFPVEVMAVRVERQRPPAAQVGGLHYEGIPSSVREARPQLLPPGRGRYVDDVQFSRHEKYEIQEGGKAVTRHGYEATGYDDPDFPVRLVKPAILDATRRAMALRIFDRIGVVTRRKQDPVVVGEIIDPRANLQWRTQDQRRVTFFIAWWLNPEDL